MEHFKSMFALLSNMPGAKPYQSTYTFTPEANAFADYTQAGACCRVLACGTAVKCRASFHARPHEVVGQASSMLTFRRLQQHVNIPPAVSGLSRIHQATSFTPKCARASSARRSETSFRSRQSRRMRGNIEKEGVDQK